MKILHVIVGLNDGGAEAVLYRLCADEALYGNQHIVVSMMDAGKYGALLQEVGVKVECLDMPRGHFTFKGLLLLWSILRTERPDVVQTWMYHADLIGGLLARLSGVRKVFWGIHNTTLEKDRSRNLTIVISKINAFLSHFIPIRVICCAERSMVVHRELGYSSKRFVVIPNGYDLNVFHVDAVARGNLRADWEIKDDVFVVGMVSRFDPHKDHENLLQAVSKLISNGNEIMCVLVGTDMNEQNVKLVGLINKYGLNGKVMLLGRRGDIPAVMSALDVHVLSSSAEAFPNVVAEAMACGIPCITTDVGDAAYIVGETGWVVPPKDSAMLATAIADAIYEKSKHKKWVQRVSESRARVSLYFSLERMRNAYNAVWRIDTI